MVKFTHLLPGKEIPDNIKKCLEEQPARSGMYNWIFVHKGEINTWGTIKDNLDDYDQIQMNMSPKDMILIPLIRRALKGSSTKLILNNDYVCEYWHQWDIDPYKYDRLQRMGDMVFGTEPHQVSQMIDGTFCIPHATNTKVLKHLGSVYDEDSVGFIFHWWAGDTYIGSRTLKKIQKKFGIKSSRVYGYWEQWDKMRKYKTYMFDDIAPLMRFPEFAQRIQGEKVIYDPNPCHTYGRNGVELACFRKPVVGSDRVFSYNKLFPDLVCDPFDYRATEKKFKLALNNDKVQDILDKAYKDVEYFNYDNSRKRWKEACDIAFDRGGTQWYTKQD